MINDSSPPPVPLRALGTTINLECDDAVVRRHVVDVLRPLCSDVPMDPPSSEVRLHTGSKISTALTRINAELITRMPYFGVHGAVLGCAEGTIAIPGSSGAGKSTATASALLAGLSYLSDEVIAVDWNFDDGGVVPYPRPLALSAWTRAALGIREQGLERYLDPDSDELYVSPTVLTTRIADDGDLLRHIVILGDYADRTRLLRVRRGEAAANLLSHAFNAWQHPATAFRLAHRLSSSATCWRLDRNGATDTGLVLRDHFGVSGE